MKPWFFACALALIAAGTAVAQESPPGGGMGGGMGGGPHGGGHRGGGDKAGSGDDKPPKPPAPVAVALDHTAYEAAWTQCHLNVDLMRRLACYERLHDDQETALKAHGGPPPR
ncbi:MAG: hypothetical protein JWO51_4357 [Rhodospirillales bacterium]|nr:hypothetical protein [Rhodospirillales bacterium]